MPEPTTSPHTPRAAGRIAGRAIRRNRLVNASLTAASRVLASLGRVGRALFLETMGLFFLLFALTGAAATYRSYRAYSTGDAGPERLILGVVFTVLFAYFSASSFWRARRRQSSS
ncbi:MAG: hypothetical protein ABIP12_01685 [Terriglobales bacterium]